MRLLLQDMFLLAAMGPPGGGRTHISGRLQSRFNLINMTFPHASLCFSFRGDYSEELTNIIKDFLYFSTLLQGETF